MEVTTTPSMSPQSLQQLDDACEYAEKQLSRLLLDRKASMSQLALQQCSSSALDTHDTWAPQLYFAILGYSYAANMSIVARVLQLPRELRDTVYTYLWDIETHRDRQRELLYWWEHFDQPWVIKGLPGLPKMQQSSVTDLKPPHFVDKALVGRHFASEVLIRLRDIVGKDLRPHGERSPVAEFALIDVSLESFMEKDVFGVGMTMEEVVRNLDLRINIQCDVLDEYSGLGEDKPTTIAQKLARESHLAILEEGVTSLSKIPYSKRIIIYDAESKQSIVRPRIVYLIVRQELALSVRDSLEPILTIVAQAFTFLKEKGFTVKIQYRSEEVGLNILFEDDVRAWTEKDWRTNIKEKNLYNVETEEWDPQKQMEVWQLLAQVLFGVELSTP